MQQITRRILASLVVLAAIGACTGKAREDTSASAAAGYLASSPAPGKARNIAMRRAAPVDAALADEAEQASTAAVPTFDATAMLIRTASAAVEVKQLDSAMHSAQQAAARLGGAVANAQIETGRDEVHRAVMQIKVPAARFDSLLAGLAPLGRLESVQVTAEDVGEEYVDIEARVANLRRLETRLVELLANRTGKLSDVLNVERELARVRGEIERIEGRRRFLQRSVAMSTLELTLHEPEPIIAGNPGSNPIAEAFRNAWRYMVGTVAWCIAALGVVIPVAIVLGALVLLGGWLRRKMQAAATLTTE